MKRIVYATRFQPNGRGDGGQRRAAQVAHLLKDLDAEVVVLQGAGTVAPETRISACLRGRYGSFISRLCRRSIAGRDRWAFSPTHRGYLVEQRAVSCEWAHRVNGVKEKPGVVLLDDPIYAWSLVKRLNALGIPVVSLCHNIETLSRWQMVEGRQEKAFRRELTLLRTCRLVVTISQEEMFLLSALGMDTRYLPYYPTPDVVCDLKRIRTFRQGSPKRGVLLLGTALNKATEEGMRKAAEMWTQTAVPRHVGPLRIAGYGTEALCEELRGRHSSLEMLGPLSQEELQHELIHTYALLCYQEDGSGMLTRIPEQLIAGVPVIANGHAARSNHGLTGLVEFEGASELSAAVKACTTLPVEFAVPAVPNVRRLQDDLMELAHP